MKADRKIWKEVAKMKFFAHLPYFVIYPMYRRCHAKYIKRRSDMTDNEKRAHDLAVAICVDVCHLKVNNYIANIKPSTTKGNLKMSEDKFYFGTESGSMSINEYIKRIDDIAKYYFEKCEKYKKRFYACCFVRIVASAIIPVISLASVINWSTVTVSVLACLIGISEAYINVTRSYEKWTKYRDACNLLWIEQRKFSVRASEYSDDETREKIFIDKCEMIMLNEMGEWRNYIERAKEMGK